MSDDPQSTIAMAIYDREWYRKESARLLGAERPPPPRHPFLEGVYDFPWRLGNLRIWLLSTMAMGLIAFFACGMHFVISILPEDLNSFAMMVYRGAWLVFSSLVVLSIVLCISPAANFLTIVEATAAGGDDIHWPDDPWLDHIGKLAYLIWVYACCLILPMFVLGCVALAMPLPKPLWWGLALFFGACLFPFALLSTLSGGAFWWLVDPQLLVWLVKKPAVAAILAALTVLMAVPCLVLAVLMVSELLWWLAPTVGVLWATCGIIYARFLGRAAWALTHEPAEKKGKKKRRKVVEDV